MTGTSVLGWLLPESAVDCGYSGNDKTVASGGEPAYTRFQHDRELKELKDTAKAIPVVGENRYNAFITTSGRSPATVNKVV